MSDKGPTDNGFFYPSQGSVVRWVQWKYANILIRQILMLNYLKKAVQPIGGLSPNLRISSYTKSGS